MQKTSYDIIIFLIVISLLTVAMISFIVTILFLYKKKQNQFFRETERMKLDYEKNLLSTRLEIQEETFLNISREIHDNISLSLTLAKLHLNTLDLDDKQKAEEQVKKSVDLLSNSILELSEISKSLNAELITQQGLLKALENEIKRIEEIKLFRLEYRVEGNPVYLEGQRELIIFRIIQESFNNIIKHSTATVAELRLNYNANKLYIDISDNGKGFENEKIKTERQAGLKNMHSRAAIINGSMNLKSIPGHGTSLSFIIPYY